MNLKMHALVLLGLIPLACESAGASADWFPQH